MAGLLRKFTDPRSARPERIAVTLAVAVSALVAIALGIDQTAARVAAGSLAAGLSVGVPIHHVLLRLDDQAREARELWGLAGVITDGRSWPAPGQWALGADALSYLESEINVRGLRVVVELGPGTSSVVLGRRFGSDIEMFGVEHDPAYAHRVRAMLAAHGLNGYHLIVTSLASDHWYGRGILDQLPALIDVLLVDGPPNWRGNGARSPAWFELGDRMAPGGIVLVDDTFRPDERKMVKSWIQGGRLSVLHDAGSFMVLEVTH